MDGPKTKSAERLRKEIRVKIRKIQRIAAQTKILLECSSSRFDSDHPALTKRIVNKPR
jgi:hypothetical protein